MGPEFHRFSQGINRRVRHLAGIEEKMVPVDRVGPVIPHAGQKYPPCFRLLHDVADGPTCPVAVLPEFERILSDGQGVGRAEGDTTMAAHAYFFFGIDLVIFRIVGMAFKGTLPNTYLALNTPVRVSLDLKFGFEMTQIHFADPPSTIP